MVVARVRRINLREPVGDVAGNRQAVGRVKPIMRVAERMNVAHGTVDGKGLFKDLASIGCVKEALVSRENAGVSGVGQKSPGPGDLKLKAHLHEEIGALELE